MTSKGNRGFADIITGGGDRPAPSRLPPRTGILQGRENRLAALASGSTVSRMQELVDPARCRIWDGHNRDYSSLDETACADLLDSLRGQNRQEVPAIVRRVLSDPEVEFEVICGARRHWSVSWLRTHGHPEFRFLVEARELTDEEAFRISDLENRSRKDLTDFERATDYAKALERHYDGSQGRMAERLQVSQSWLSRYLELARLPDGVISAFGSPHALGISHAARLAPALRAPATRTGVLAAAAALQAEQIDRLAAGGTTIPPATVLRRLLASPKPPHKAAGRAERKDAQGRNLVQAERSRGGAITVLLPKPREHGLDEVLMAVTDVVKQLLT